MSAAVASIVTTSNETTTSTMDSADNREQQPVCCVGVNDQQIEILTETWKQVDDEESKQNVGITLFKRLVHSCPEI